MPLLSVSGSHRAFVIRRLPGLHHPVLTGYSSYPIRRDRIPNRSVQHFYFHCYWCGMKKLCEDRWFCALAPHLLCVVSIAYKNQHISSMLKCNTLYAWSQKKLTHFCLTVTNPRALLSSSFASTTLDISLLLECMGLHHDGMPYVSCLCYHNVFPIVHPHLQAKRWR